MNYLDLMCNNSWTRYDDDKRVDVDVIIFEGKKSG